MRKSRQVSSDAQFASKEMIIVTPDASENSSEDLLL